MRPYRCGRVGLCLLILVAVLASPPPAWPCSCFALSGPEALPQAAAMFTARATQVEFLAPDTKNTEPPILVTFDVYEVWKGPLQKTLRLRTIYNKWTCQGYYFKQGRTYLVTAYQTSLTDQGDVELAKVNPCGATRELSDAGAVLQRLGSGKKPAADKPE